MVKPNVTTEVTRKKKPHDKFRMKMQFDSLPIELDVEAAVTNVEVKDLRFNPKKYSFGKIQFKDGVLEACIYPLKNIDSTLFYYKTDSLNKGRFVIDSNKTKRFLCLIMKIRYFLALTKKRKLKYLHRKGFFANINTYNNNFTTQEKQNYRSYLEVLK